MVEECHRAQSRQIKCNTKVWSSFTFSEVPAGQNDMFQSVSYAWGDYTANDRTKQGRGTWCKLGLATMSHYIGCTVTIYQSLTFFTPSFTLSESLLILCSPPLPITIPNRSVTLPKHAFFPLFLIFSQHNMCLLCPDVKCQQNKYMAQRRHVFALLTFVLSCSMRLQDWHFPVPNDKYNLSSKVHLFKVIISETFI